MRGRFIMEGIVNGWESDKNNTIIAERQAQLPRSGVELWCDVNGKERQW